MKKLTAIIGAAMVASFCYGQDFNTGASIDGDSIIVNGDNVSTLVNDSGYITNAANVKQDTDSQAGSAKTVTFTGDAFAATPAVNVTFSEDIGEVATVYVTNQSTSGFTYFFRDTEDVVTNAWSVDWIATDGGNAAAGSGAGTLYSAMLTVTNDAFVVPSTFAWVPVPLANATFGATYPHHDNQGYLNANGTNINIDADTAGTYCVGISIRIDGLFSGAQMQADVQTFTNGVALYSATPRIMLEGSSVVNPLVYGEAILKLPPDAVMTFRARQNDTDGEDEEFNPFFTYITLHRISTDY